MKHFISLVLTFFLLTTAYSSYSAPRIVVSIPPLYDLVTGLTNNVNTETVLLVPPNASPHDYALRPSQAKALFSADIVIWVGENLETFLIKSLSQLNEQTTLVTVMNFPMTYYPFRQALLWQSSDDHDHAHNHIAKHDVDPHVWLDPLNAIVITREIAKVLQQRDPTNATQYEKNKNIMVERLQKLTADVSHQLQSIQSKKFIVFHDAYQYFEKRFHLHALGAITLHPESIPSPKRIQAIKNLLISDQVRCVFREPQFNTKLIDLITENTTVKQGVLNPLGTAGASGLDAYEALIQNLSQSLHGCLS